MTTEPTWIRDGGTAALIETNRQVSFETIARITATQIVTADGRRFRRGGFRSELASDNGHGSQTSRRGRLVDPADPGTVAMFAQQQLRHVANEAQRTTYGPNATIHTMDPEAVRTELGRLADVINAARKEVDRRAHL